MAGSEAKTASTHYFPLARSERYPRLKVDFTKCKAATLRRYLKAFDVPIRAECSSTELAVATGRHFDSFLEVDEEDTIGAFLNFVKKSAPGAEGLARATGKRVRERRRKRPTRRDEDDGGGGAEGAGGDGGSGEESGRRYCVCSKEQYGEMIGCDDSNCKVEWFHLGCVGLTSATRPRGHWYCPDCRVKNGGGGDSEGDGSGGGGGGGGEEETGGRRGNGAGARGGAQRRKAMGGGSGAAKRPRVGDVRY